MVAWKIGLRQRVVAASTVALVLAAAALAVALTSAADGRAQGRELSQRLVPAADASVDLTVLYTAQQTSLRNYVTDPRSGSLDTFNSEKSPISNTQNQIGRLVSGYAPITEQLSATRTAYRAWLADVAGPQLAAVARGDAATAQAMQADTARTRPYVLAIRSAGSGLQLKITATLQTAIDQLNRAQRYLLAALIAVCVVIAAIVANALTAVWFGVLRPFLTLRLAMDAVAAGDYDTHIPVVGPPEIADLCRRIELMRDRLATSLAQRERAEQRFRRLFDTAPDAMIAVAADGSVAMANARALHMFGYEATELIGLQVEMLIPEGVREALTAERQVYFADSPSRPIDAEFKLRGLRRDGRTFPAEITLAGLPVGNGIGMLVTAAIRDVSERLALEAERERLRAAAEQERVERRLQQSQRLESLGQLVGGVAHDFNNLLNVIQGYADDAAEQISSLAQADAGLAPDLPDDIEQVRVAAQQAIRLTRQLLTFARHEVTRPEVLDLNESVRGAGQLLRRTLGEHIELIITTEASLWRVKADRGQVEQVLVNLAVNARDAMPGGGRLVIDTANAEVDEAYATSWAKLTPGRYARLRVSDSGTGMDRATAERVFEPFFSTKPKGRGTGLGLATVYGVVTGAGGSIEIYSEVGLGTTVTVLLPATDEDAAPAADLAVSGDGASGHGETILLVEDEASLRKLTSRILTHAGYLVCAADDGADAVRMAGDPAQVIDLLLTDVVMPEMLGNEVAARVSTARPGVPALFMSGYAQAILDTHGVPEPSFDIMEKPFTKAALLSRVRQAITRNHPDPLTPPDRT
jgi:PAS domain S-box-containing protein